MDENQNIPEKPSEISSTAPESSVSPQPAPANTEVPDGNPESGKSEEEKIPFSALAFDWAKTFFFSLIGVLFVFTLLVRGVTVDGESMNSTLADRDYLVISNIFYTPATGDIIVLQCPDYKEGEEPLVKRVIATGGQSVRINCKTWEVWVDGVLLSEDYVLRTDSRDMYAEDLELDQEGVAEFVVEEGRVFVMGDNRNNSLDSRSKSIGQIDERYIMGRLLFRLFPVSSFGAV